MGRVNPGPPNHYISYQLPVHTVNRKHVGFYRIVWWFFSVSLYRVIMPSDSTTPAAAFSPGIGKDRKRGRDNPVRHKSCILPGYPCRSGSGYPNPRHSAKPQLLVPLFWSYLLFSRSAEHPHRRSAKIYANVYNTRHESFACDRRVAHLLWRWGRDFP